MKRLLLFLLLAGSLGGCAVNEDDRDFYYRGWVRPTDLDRAPPTKLGPRSQPAAGYPRDPLID